MDTSKRGITIFLSDNFQLVILKIQLNNHSTNRCYMEVNTTMQQRFLITVFFSD